jgi:hypothetical protein
MAWEVRGDRRYYYRSVREGGKVRRVYVGRGPVAEAAAEFDALARSVRDDARDRSKAAGGDWQRRLAAALEPLRRLDALVGALAALTLVDAGYHRPHRGAWRRRTERC